MRSTRKNILYGAAGAVMLAAALLGCSCSAPNSNNTEHSQANAGINQILANQPVPIFDSSQQRSDMMEAEAIMALGSATTTFFFPPGTVIMAGADGKNHYSLPPFKTCPSEGEPIANTSSLTNPLQVTSGGQVVSQMDPDGIYPPTASEGTFVLCDTANGSQRLSYWEGLVETETGTAVWDAANGTITDIGDAQLPVCTLVTAQDGNKYKLATGSKYYHCVKAAGDPTKSVKTQADFAAAS